MAESILVNLLDELQIRDEALSENELKQHMPSFLNNITSQSTSWKNKTNAMTLINNQFRFNNPSIQSHVEEILIQLSRNEVLTMKNCIDDDSLSDFADFYREFVFSLLIFQDHFPSIFVKYFKQLLKFLTECFLFNTKPNCSPLHKAIIEYIKITSLEFWGSLKVPPVPEEFMELWVNAVQLRVKQMLPVLLESMVLQDEHAYYLEYGPKEESQDGIDFNEIVMRQSNVRNFAALSLENLTTIFPSEITNELKPHIEKWIQGEDWKHVEAMILALSAYVNAIGLPAHLVDSLNNIMPKLIDLLSSPNPLLRAISCFGLSHLVNCNIKNQKEVLGKILRKSIVLMSDSCEETHNSALRAIQKIMANSSFAQLQPFLDEIYKSLLDNRNVFTEDDRIVYYECCSHFCIFSQESVDNDKKSTLLTPLLEEWLSRKIDFTIKSSSDEIDSDMVRLSHIFCVTLQYIGELFDPHIDKIFLKLDQSLKEIKEARQSNLYIEERSSGDSIASDHLSSFIVSCLDVINSIFEGLPARALTVAKAHSFLNIIYTTLTDTFFGKCHQSAFSLLGHLIYSDLSKANKKNEGDHLRGPNMVEFLKLIKPILEKKEASNVQCNALWALVCIIKTKQVEFEMLQPFIEHLVVIFEQTDGQQECIVNAAWALTQLLQNFPSQMANVVTRQDVFAHLCALLQFQFSQEYARFEILESFVTCLQPLMKKLTSSDWVNLLAAIAINSTLPNEELQSKLKTFLHTLRTEIGIPSWNKAMQDLGTEYAHAIKKAYKFP